MATHFQSCFYIKYARKSFGRVDSLFRGITTRIRDWIYRKEDKKGKFLIPGTENFQDKFWSSIIQNFPSKNWYRTVRCVSAHEGEKKQIEAWGIRYIERPKRNSALQWETNIGLRRIDQDTLMLHIEVSNEVSPDSPLISGDENKPKPTIPNFVRDLILEGRHTVYLANAESPSRLNVQSGCLEVKSSTETKDLFTQLVDSPLRRYPIIVAYGDYKAENAANYLHDKLLGKVFVVYLRNTPEVKKAVDESENKHRIPFNRIRVFYPVRSRVFNQPIQCDSVVRFNEQTGKWEGTSLALDVIGKLLSVFKLESRHSVKTIDEVQHLVEIERMRVEKTATSQKEFDDFVEDYEKLEKDYKEYVVIADEEIQKKDKYISTLEGRIEAKDMEIQRALSICTTIANTGYPSNLKELLLFFNTMFSGRLIIHDEALDSAEEFESDRDLPKAWSLLSALSTTLYEMKFIEKNLEKGAFKQRTGIDLAMTEGRTTKRTGTLAKIRELDYKGKTVKIFPHLKSGTDNNCLRLYFAFIDEEKKILVGHFGSHLDNATTRKIK
ncbi:MAG: hypothetical protein IJA81_07880 [Akkermansia sp.]|nr:hypothetical protein [Akkermansia sp.]